MLLKEPPQCGDRLKTIPPEVRRARGGGGRGRWRRPPGSHGGAVSFLVGWKLGGEHCISPTRQGTESKCNWSSLFPNTQLKQFPALGYKWGEGAGPSGRSCSFPAHDSASGQPSPSEASLIHSAEPRADQALDISRFKRAKNPTERKA